MSNLATRVLGDSSNVRRIWDEAGQRMSQCGAAIRNSGQIEQALGQISQQLDSLADTVTASREGELQWVFRLRDTLISQKVYLSAMLDYVAQGGKSRGSALYTDPAGTKPFAQLPDAFIFCLDDGSRGNLVQEVKLVDGQCQFHWRPVRPIPEDDDFFENVWRAFRETGNFD